MCSHMKNSDDYVLRRQILNLSDFEVIRNIPQGEGDYIFL